MPTVSIETTLTLAIAALLLVVGATLRLVVLTSLRAMGKVRGRHPRPAHLAPVTTRAVAMARRAGNGGRRFVTDTLVPLFFFLLATIAHWIEVAWLKLGALVKAVVRFLERVGDDVFERLPEPELTPSDATTFPFSPEESTWTQTLNETRRLLTSH
jgi:hypothetical protein